jgi:hypothetical protein
MLREYINALRNTICPLRRIADNRGATHTGSVTGKAGRVVHLRAGHRRGDGLWFCRCLDDGCVSLLLLARQIDLANRRDPLQDSRLIFGRLARVYLLRGFRHLRCQDVDADSGHNEDADNEGIHVKKFLVPTQLTAPELVCEIRPNDGSGGGGRLYNKRAAQSAV